MRPLDLNGDDQTRPWPPKPDVYDRRPWGPLPTHKEYRQAFKAWSLPYASLELPPPSPKPAMGEQFHQDENTIGKVAECLVGTILDRVRRLNNDPNPETHEAPCETAQSRQVREDHEGPRGWAASEFLEDLPEAKGTVEEVVAPVREPASTVDNATYHGRRVMDGRNFTVKQLRTALGSKAAIPPRARKADLQRLLAEREAARGSSVPGEVPRPKPAQDASLNLLPAAPLLGWQVEAAHDHRLPYRTGPTYTAWDLYTWAIHCSPYNPTYWVARAYLFYQLGSYSLALGDAHRAMILTETLVEPVGRARRSGLYGRAYDAVEQHLLIESGKNEAVSVALRGDQNVLYFLYPVRKALHHVIAMSLLACNAIEDCLALDQHLLERILMFYEDAAIFGGRLEYCRSRSKFEHGPGMTTPLRDGYVDIRKGLVEAQLGECERPVPQTRWNARVNDDFFRDYPLHLESDKHVHRVIADRDLFNGDIIYTELPAVRGHLLPLQPSDGKPSVDVLRDIQQVPGTLLYTVVAQNKGYFCEHCKRLVDTDQVQEGRMAYRRLALGGHLTGQDRHRCACLFQDPMTVFCMPARATELRLRGGGMMTRAGRKRKASKSELADEGEPERDPVTEADRVTQAAAAAPMDRPSKRARTASRATTASQPATADDVGPPAAPELATRLAADMTCLEKARASYHGRSCGIDWAWLHQAMQPAKRVVETEPMEEQHDHHGTHLSLLLRDVFEQTLRQHDRAGDADRHIMPHEIDAMMPLPTNEGGGQHPCPFGWAANIVVPFDTLECLGVDIFRNFAFDTWSIQLVLRKLALSFVPWDAWCEGAGNKRRHSRAGKEAPGQPLLDDLYIHPGFSTFRKACIESSNAAWFYDYKDPQSLNRICVRTQRLIRKGEEIRVLHPTTELQIPPALAMSPTKRPHSQPFVDLTLRGDDESFSSREPKRVKVEHNEIALVSAAASDTFLRSNGPGSLDVHDPSNDDDDLPPLSRIGGPMPCTGSTRTPKMERVDSPRAADARSVKVEMLGLATPAATPIVPVAPGDDPVVPASASQAGVDTSGSRARLEAWGDAQTPAQQRQDDSDDDDQSNPEEREINRAFAGLSQFPDVNHAQTAWVDDVIYSRPSRGDIEEGLAGQQDAGKITDNELNVYLESVQNRPGHVRRRRRLVRASQLRRSDRAAGDSSPSSPRAAQASGSPARDITSSTGDAAAEQHSDDEHDPVAEREEVTRTAIELGLKRRRKMVTRRELIDDAHNQRAPADTMTSRLLSQSREINQGSIIPSEQDGTDSQVELIAGANGEPLRYKVTRELREFWTVRGMVTSLLDHQILGVHWMLNRELGDTRPRGGLVADMMGLGKTMQVIATMVLNRPAVDAMSKQPRTTLIVAPTALLQQWESEMLQHTAEGTFQVFVHHGTNKIRGISHLQRLDVVITSYNTIMMSHPSPKRPAKDMSEEEVEAWWEEQWEKRKEFHRVKFYRVVLDESQYIKNSKTRMSVACTALRAAYKWSVSGTPIQNSLMDMYPQFRFLGHPRFSDLSVFKRVFGTSGKSQARSAKAMQVELTRTMLRRTKDSTLCGRKLLDLTPKVVSLTDVEFSQDERYLYNIMEKRSIAKINELRHSGGGDNSFYMSVLGLLMRLRQICNHPSLVLKFLRQDFTTEELKLALAREAEEAEGIARGASEQDRRPRSGRGPDASVRGWVPYEGNDPVPTPHRTDRYARRRWPFPQTEAHEPDSAATEEVETKPKVETQPNMEDASPKLEVGVKGEAQEPGADDAADANSDHTDTVGATAGSADTKDEPTNTKDEPRPDDDACAARGPLEELLENGEEQEAESEEQCTLCVSPLEAPVMIQRCRHTFCRDCLAAFVEETAAGEGMCKCPICMEEFQQESDSKRRMPSAKMKALTKQLQHYRETRPDDKIIIFSQFTQMLDLVWEICEKEGWESTRYQGRMTLSEREDSLKRFKTDPDCCIMLVSLKAGGVGLNLTVANLVLSIDLWWNAAVELQAFDRVHRLGQEKDVFVTRFMVKGTVEQRILELQNYKLMVADAAMGEGLGRVARLTKRELMGLFYTLRSMHHGELETNREDRD
ncbi:MAG: hypothetical protein M1838_002323 [Thelocarpon superellum]|nr:MAG: hypothetical protein M1838_002323 [Thelocarpon superellum]